MLLPATTKNVYALSIQDDVLERPNLINKKEDRERRGERGYGSGEKHRKQRKKFQNIFAIQKKVNCYFQQRKSSFTHPSIFIFYL